MGLAIDKLLNKYRKDYEDLERGRELFVQHNIPTTNLDELIQRLRFRYQVLEEKSRREAVVNARTQLLAYRKGWYFHGLRGGCAHFFTNETMRDILAYRRSLCGVEGVLDSFEELGDADIDSGLKCRTCAKLLEKGHHQ